MNGCSISECGRPHYAHGWCKAHYYRWRKHGDPLGGGAPRGSSAGSPASYFREVVLAYEGNDCLTWPFTCNNAGYGQMRAGGRSIIVSRRVCEETHGPAPTPDHEAAHSCGHGDQACVTKAHLSWKTHAGNQADMIAHGTNTCGDRHASAKLKSTDVLEVRRLRGSVTGRELAQKFGVSEAQISRAQTGSNWKHI